jgi:predicted porin
LCCKKQNNLIEYYASFQKYYTLMKQVTLRAGKACAPVALVLGLGVTQIANADLRVYGSIRQAVVHSDGTDDARIVDVNSRFGLQGSEVLGSGMVVFGRWEWGADASVQDSSPGTRLGYIGISGDFGSLSIGSQWSAWDGFVGGDHMNVVDEGDWHNGTRRNGRSLKFAGNYKGVSFESDVVVAPEESGANEAVLDEIQFAVGYQLADLVFQGAIISRDGGEGGYLDGGRIAGARVSYTNDSLALSAAIADAEGFSDGAEELFGIKLRASLTRGPNDFIAVFTSSEDSESGGELRGLSLGYQHNFSERTRVRLEMASVDPDLAGRDKTMEGGVMFRHDW